MRSGPGGMVGVRAMRRGDDHPCWVLDERPAGCWRYGRVVSDGRDGVRCGAVRSARMVMVQCDGVGRAGEMRRIGECRAGRRSGGRDRVVGGRRG